MRVRSDRVEHHTRRPLYAFGKVGRITRHVGGMVFAAPWEARVFGTALSLHEGGVFAWDVFRERLIAQIALAHHRASELNARVEALAARPTGHDHDRGDHDHDHD